MFWYFDSVLILFLRLKMYLKNIFPLSKYAPIETQLFKNVCLQY